MTTKPKWTDRIHSPIRVLNHADGLRLSKFTDADLDQIADCDDVFELDLGSNRTAQPVDLSRLAHIKGLRHLGLGRMTFTNLQALQALPNLRSLNISGCDFSDFDGLNGLHVETLFLWNNKLAGFPAGLDLPKLSALLLSHNRITDLSFVASYPTLKCLHVNGNRITDVSPLAGCAALETLHIDDNPLTTLAPLAGRRYQRLHVSSHLSAERAALQLELPEKPYVRTPESIEASRIAKLMEAKDWPQLYVITDLALLGDAFSSLVHGHFDEEMVRGALAHPAPGAFDAMVTHGLRPHYWEESKLLVSVLCSFGERLVAPLTQSFHAELAFYPEYEPFYAGKLKLEHATIARILVEAPIPAFADLFLAFFDLRDSFSEAHLHHYKRLLDVVGKAQSAQLVAPIIDLLGFEKHILGGDAAFMKKVFKAIGQLGTKADAALLASRFNVTTETRADVAEAYEATLKKLEKKKS